LQYGEAGTLIAPFQTPKPTLLQCISVHNTKIQRLGLPLVTWCIYHQIVETVLAGLQATFIS